MARSVIRLVLRSDTPVSRLYLAYISPISRLYLIRLVLRSDTLTPVIFCDPMFFTLGYDRSLQLELLRQANELAVHMHIPVVHAGSVLPLLGGADCAEAAQLAEGELAEGFRCRERSVEINFECYVRRVKALDYEIAWVDLLEIDGVAPYSYSEELPYDELLQQHVPGVQSRTPERPMLVVAALPRADSPSAERYVAERKGETAWTMDLGDDVQLTIPRGGPSSMHPREPPPMRKFDPNARRDEEDTPVPTNYIPAPLDH